MRLGNNSRPCEKCGGTPEVLHTPVRASGQYCEKCLSEGPPALITADAGGSNGPRLRLWKGDASARSLSRIAAEKLNESAGHFDAAAGYAHVARPPLRRIGL
jgi:hypothetical protein